jgi:hypothetical protein
MEILINKKKYKVDKNEYNKIDHVSYNNLKLYNELAVHERIIALIQKCKQVYCFEPDFISYNTKHGGFIPIKLSGNFTKIYHGYIQTFHYYPLDYKQNYHKKKS